MELITEEGWKLLKRNDEIEIEHTGCLVYHSLYSRHLKHYGYTADPMLEIAYSIWSGGKCGWCGEQAPASIYTPWVFLNWDVIPSIQPDKRHMEWLEKKSSQGWRGGL